MSVSALGGRGWAGLITVTFCAGRAHAGWLRDATEMFRPGACCPLAMPVALLARVRNVNQLARIKAGLIGLVGQQFQNRLGQLLVACQYP